MKKSETAFFSFKTGERKNSRAIPNLYFWSFLFYAIFVIWCSGLLSSIDHGLDNLTLTLIFNTSAIQPILSSIAEVLRGSFSNFFLNCDNRYPTCCKQLYPEHSANVQARLLDASVFHIFCLEFGAHYSCYAI